MAEHAAAAAGAGTAIDYVGTELELFAAATQWKGYLRHALTPFISGDVAEVGAGIGATTHALGTAPGATHWTCIEPDGAMFAKLSAEAPSLPAPQPVALHHGVLADLPVAPSFDTILYIDVLEHIADEAAELREAEARLRAGGRIVALCPAWQFLFTPFDRAIGHYRRHSKSSLRRSAGPGLIERKAFYLDSVGMLASLANKLALRQAMPTPAQIQLWDKWLVPASRLLDPLARRWLGKSVVLIWEKQ